MGVDTNKIPHPKPNCGHRIDGRLITDIAVGSQGAVSQAIVLIGSESCLGAVGAHLPLLVVLLFGVPHVEWALIHPRIQAMLW